MKSVSFQLALVALLALEVALWAATRGAPESGPSLRAWRHAAQYGEPDPAAFDDAFVAARLEQLAGGPAAELRDALYVFTSDVNRLTGPRAQLEWVADALARPVDRRAYLGLVLQLRKTGGSAVGASGAMSAQEWRWAARALSDAPWPAALAGEIQAHFAPLRTQIEQHLAR